MMKTWLLSISATLFISASAFPADLKCDSPGVAQLIIVDMFKNNPSAQKLEIEVDGITMTRVDRTGNEPVCFVRVDTNHGYSLNYRFTYDRGLANLDMAP